MNLPNHIPYLFISIISIIIISPASQPLVTPFSLSHPGTVEPFIHAEFISILRPLNKTGLKSMFLQPMKHRVSVNRTTHNKDKSFCDGDEFVV